MENIYCVLISDRHVDPSVEMAFRDSGDAVEKAREMAKRYCRHDEDYEEKSFSGSHILFIATYSCEGDSIYVCETELSE